MKNLILRSHVLLTSCLLLAPFFVAAQTDTSAGTFWHPNPPVYAVKQALEVESLVPMFFTGGYHFALGYRYKNSGSGQVSSTEAYTMRKRPG